VLLLTPASACMHRCTDPPAGVRLRHSQARGISSTGSKNSSQQNWETSKLTWSVSTHFYAAARQHAQLGRCTLAVSSLACCMPQAPWQQQLLTAPTGSPAQMSAASAARGHHRSSSQSPLHVHRPQHAQRSAAVVATRVAPVSGATSPSQP
jgi:hypothetical protein